MHGGVKFGQGGLILRSLLCLVSEPHVREDLIGLTIPERLNLFRHGYTPVQNNGPTVQHGSVVDPNLPAVLPLVPQGPLFRSPAVFLRAVQPRLFPFAVGGVGHAGLAVHLDGPPHVAPPEEHRVAVVQLRLVEPVDSGPGALRTCAVCTVVAVIGNVVGRSRIGLAGDKGITFHDGGFCGKDGVPPGLPLLKELLRPGVDRLILRKPGCGLRQALEQPHRRHDPRLIGQGLGQLHGERIVGEIQQRRAGDQGQSADGVVLAGIQIVQLLPVFHLAGNGNAGAVPPVVTLLKESITATDVRGEGVPVLVRPAAHQIGGEAVGKFGRIHPLGGVEQEQSSVIPADLLVGGPGGHLLPALHVSAASGDDPGKQSHHFLLRNDRFFVPLRIPRSKAVPERPLILRLRGRAFREDPTGRRLLRRVRGMCAAGRYKEHQPYGKQQSHNFLHHRIHPLLFFAKNRLIL